MDVGFCYINIKRLCNEPFRSYIERIYFILNNKDKVDEETLIYYSKFLFMIKYVGCSYDETIMNDIKKYAKNAGIQIE